MLLPGNNQAKACMKILFVVTFKDKYQRILMEGKIEIETVEQKREQLKNLFACFVDNINYYKQEEMLFQANGLDTEKANLMILLFIFFKNKFIPF